MAECAPKLDAPSDAGKRTGFKADLTPDPVGCTDLHRESLPIGKLYRVVVVRRPVVNPDTEGGEDRLQQDLEVVDQAASPFPAEDFQSPPEFQRLREA
jgi:hypothetical protein